jgi:hypothetical protein
MTKPYGMYFSDVSGVGPELYDADTDRDVGYLYANPDADRIARQWAHAPVLIAAAKDAEELLSALHRAGVVHPGSQVVGRLREALQAIGALS